MFKIGDRVRLIDKHSQKYLYPGEGSVVSHECDGARIWYKVQFDSGRVAEWLDFALKLVEPAPATRGPRPLPIRQRVTLTAGKSLRAPARDMWSKVYTLTGPRLRDGERSWFV